MKQEDNEGIKLRPRDLPVNIVLGDICQNASWAYRIMVAIQEQRYEDAHHIAKLIFEHNDKIANDHYDMEKLNDMIKTERQKYN